MLCHYCHCSLASDALDEFEESQKLFVIDLTKVGIITPQDSSSRFAESRC